MFDVVSFIVDAEDGILSEEEFYTGLQEMIDSGIVWSLQGTWQRAAEQAIDGGYCTP